MKIHKNPLIFYYPISDKNIRLFGYPNPTFWNSHPTRPESDFWLPELFDTRLFATHSSTIPFSSFYQHCCLRPGRKKGRGLQKTKGGYFCVALWMETEYIMYYMYAFSEKFGKPCLFKKKIGDGRCRKKTRIFI